jgi:hypothetical protein
MPGSPGCTDVREMIRRDMDRDMVAAQRQQGGDQRLPAGPSSVAIDEHRSFM